MGKEKRADKDTARKKREAERRPASSDTADLDPANKASQAQREEYDERGLEIEDVRAHIIGATGAEIVINRGIDDGVVPGMHGHITNGAGEVVGHFIVGTVRDANCTATTIRTNHDVAHHHKDVVLNPSYE
ncbi:MAG TPA: hypothetical protein VIU61_18860 [Kofleriaceae bacterium]